MVIPDYILRNLRERKGREPDDYSKDSEFENMTLTEVVEEYFAWEGIIGYGEEIVEVVTDLQEFNKEESK